MQYANFLIRQTRLEKNWSQEGLCSGICTVSYLSKIEQGKAHPSQQVLQLLLQRMGIQWNILPAYEIEAALQQAYEYLFSYNTVKLQDLLQTSPWQQCKNSALELDYQILKQYITDFGVPLPSALEVCMTPRQLALQRNLQERYEEAIQLYPCSFLYMTAGTAACSNGNNVQAMELLQLANQLAAQEGRAHIMLLTRIIMGNCYSNLRDFENMNKHYLAAKRLACDVNCAALLDTINYNIAATQIELGQYQDALPYFANHKNPTPNILHKLAICYEKLGQTQNALSALDKADSLKATLPEQLNKKMCNVVRLRLLDKNYLDSQTYGDALLECFALCKKYLSIGYCIFHLPWMLEWYEHHRQYKQSYQLLREFPV